MRSLVAWRKPGARRRVSIPACVKRLEQARSLAPIFAAMLCAVALAACERVSAHAAAAANPVRPGAQAPIPVPDKALLKPAAAPDCEFRSGGPTPEETQRMKLDYERQCYRHAEMIARGKLQQLQASVGETIKAVKRSE